jgi:hypothetical protein
MRRVVASALVLALLISASVGSNVATAGLLFILRKKGNVESSKN